MTRSWIALSSCRDLYGSERALLETMEALPSHARDVVACVPGQSELAAELVRRGVRVRPLPAGWAPLRHARQLALGLSLLARSPRAIYFNEGNQLRLAWLLSTLGRAPVTVHLRTLGEVVRVNELARAWRWPTRLHLIPISDFLVDRLEAPPTAVTRIYDGFRAEPSAPARLDGKERPLRACLVGRLVPQKRQAFVIEALGRHRELLDGIDWAVTMLGGDPDGAYGRSLQQRVVELGLEGRIRLLPFTPSVGEVYRDHHLVLIPARDEALGRTWFEAVAARVPPLVASVGGPAELTARYEVGTTFRVDDGADFCRALAAALTNPEACTPSFGTRIDRALAAHDLADAVARVVEVVLRGH